MSQTNLKAISVIRPALVFSSLFCSGPIFQTRLSKKLVKKNFSYGMQNAPCGETH